MSVRTSSVYANRSSSRSKCWMSVVTLVLCLVTIEVSSSFMIDPFTNHLRSTTSIDTASPTTPSSWRNDGAWTRTMDSRVTPRVPTTQLHYLPVPDGFFTWSGIFIGLSLSFSRSMTRVIIENRAWERRLEEAREIRLEEDPTLTELDLRREEAANSPSIYGPTGQTKKRQTNNNNDDDDEEYEYTMTEEEIKAFEKEFGIAYDPYYDEPYEEDELPDDMPYTVDRTYGDRRYENGEIFYYDKETGLYYRQGGKPRLKQFWE